MDIELLRLSAAIAKMIDDGWQDGELASQDHERALRVLKRVQEGIMMQRWRHGKN